MRKCVDPGLGTVQNDNRLISSLVGLGLDDARSVDEVPQDRFLANDLGMEDDIGRRGHRGGQAGQIVDPADLG
jgi:hypothetical protein